MWPLMGCRLQKIDVSLEENSGSGHRDRLLRNALVALQRDGIVCLERAIPRQSVEELNVKMQSDLKAVKLDRSLEGRWRSLRPPPFDPYLYQPIIFNDFAVDVCIALLGSDATLTTYGANTS